MLIWLKTHLPKGKKTIKKPKEKGEGLAGRMAEITQSLFSFWENRNGTGGFGTPPWAQVWSFISRTINFGGIELAWIYTEIMPRGLYFLM